VKVNFSSREEFEKLVYQQPERFLDRIRVPEVFVIQRFYDPQEILALRQRVFAGALQTDPSWHPLLDDCPDYHRLHDNYPNAYVKAKMHAFYFHGWREENSPLFRYFQDIFRMKCYLGGMDVGLDLRNTPSQGFVARVNLQNYPRGGGYISEHIDPNSKFALIQTLIQASDPQRDFHSGGLFARASDRADKVYLDHHSKPGDLMVLSPGIPHGVDPIDEGGEYDWRLNSGKWTILPLFVASDVPGVHAEKPREYYDRKG
jgi:hypothetical protein